MRERPAAGERGDDAGGAAAAPGDVEGDVERPEATGRPRLSQPSVCSSAASSAPRSVACASPSDSVAAIAPFSVPPPSSACARSILSAPADDFRSSVASVAGMRQAEVERLLPSGSSRAPGRAAARQRTAHRSSRRVEGRVPARRRSAASSGSDTAVELERPAEPRWPSPSSACSEPPTGCVRRRTPLSMPG